MTLQATDISLRLSGGSSNTSQIASLGGVKSTSTVASSALFDDVSSVEASTGDTEYRCVYINNANAGTDVYYGVKIWIQTNTPSASTDMAIGLGTAGLNATEQTVANENTAPIGVTFSSPTSFATGLTVGDIPAGQHFSIWVRRTVTAGATPASDSATIQYQGDYNP